MPLSAGQYSRLRFIIRDLDICKDHASPHVRAAVEGYSRAEIASAIEKIEKILKADNGRDGYDIISAWHERSVLAVLDLFRRRRDWPVYKVDKVDPPEASV